MTDSGFEKRFKARLKQAIDSNSFVDAEGKTGGFFSVSVSNANSGSLATIHVSLTKFDNKKHGKTSRVGFNISSGMKDSEEAKKLIPLVESILSESGFCKYNVPLNAESLPRKLGVEISNFLQNHPEYQADDNGIIGIFSASIRPSKIGRNTSTALITFHPISHIEESKNSWLHTADQIEFSQFPTNQEEVQEMLEAAGKYLESLGFKNHKLASTQSTSKEIPKEWIDKEQVKIVKKNKEGLVIQLVQRTVNKKPVIYFRPETDNYEAVQKMCEAIVEGYLPTALASQDTITIDKIREFLEEKELFTKKSSKYRERMPSDIREIIVGDKNYATLYSPQVIEHKDSTYSIRISIAPPTFKNCNDVIRDSSTTCIMPINTSDLDTASQMARFFQDLSEIALTDFFTKNPNVSILTVPQTVTIKGKQKIIRKVAYEHDYNTTDDDKKLLIDGKRLHDVIDQYIDLARELTWKISFAAKDKDNPNAEQIVTLQAFRNLHETLTEDLSPFHQEFKVTADSLDTARKFYDVVLSTLLNKEAELSEQPFLKNMRVERGLKHFGDESIRSILKESLKKGLALDGISVEGKFLNLLQKEAKESERVRN